MAVPKNLTQLTDAQIGMAFGMAVQSQPGTLPDGALALMADELARRGFLQSCMAALSPDRQASLVLQITVDRTRLRRPTANGRPMNITFHTR